MLASFPIFLVSIKRRLKSIHFQEYVQDRLYNPVTIGSIPVEHWAVG